MDILINMFYEYLNKSKEVSYKDNFYYRKSKELLEVIKDLDIKVYNELKKAI